MFPRPLVRKKSDDHRDPLVPLANDCTVSALHLDGEGFETRPNPQKELIKCLRFQLLIDLTRFYSRREIERNGGNPLPISIMTQAQYTTFPILDKPVNYLGIGKNHPFADLFLRDPQGLYSLHKIIAKVAVKLPLDLSNLFFPLVGKGAGEVLPDNLPAITYQTIDNYIEDI
jgi:hypothetical protein